jgi:hypothetical protein
MRRVAREVFMLEQEPLKPCPLCGGVNVRDLGHGITCYGCGLWLGDGTLSSGLGGYREVWQNRGGMVGPTHVEKEDGDGR